MFIVAENLVNVHQTRGSFRTLYRIVWLALTLDLQDCLLGLLDEERIKSLHIYFLAPYPEY